MLTSCSPLSCVTCYSSLPCTAVSPVHTICRPTSSVNVCMRFGTFKGKTQTCKLPLFLCICPEECLSFVTFQTTCFLVQIVRCQRICKHNSATSLLCQWAKGCTVGNDRVMEWEVFFYQAELPTCTSVDDQGERDLIARIRLITLSDDLIPFCHFGKSPPTPGGNMQLLGSLSFGAFYASTPVRAVATCLCFQVVCLILVNTGSQEPFDGISLNWAQISTGTQQWTDSILVVKHQGRCDLESVQLPSLQLERE